MANVRPIKVLILVLCVSVAPSLAGMQAGDDGQATDRATPSCCGCDAAAQQPRSCCPPATVQTAACQCRSQPPIPDRPQPDKSLGRQRLEQTPAQIKVQIVSQHRRNDGFPPFRTCPLPRMDPQAVLCVWRT